MHGFVDDFGVPRAYLGRQSIATRDRMQLDDDFESLGALGAESNAPPADAHSLMISALGPGGHEPNGAPVEALMISESLAVLGRQSTPP
ncbi:hypothetical protein H0E87_031532, partial [Populus deltoides]